MRTVYLLAGTVRERIMICLRAAGWHKGRKTDLSAVRAFYASDGITLPKGAEAFLREYYGLAESWHLKETLWEINDPQLAGETGEIEFFLNPLRRQAKTGKLMPGRAAARRRMQSRVEESAGEPLVCVGCIGHYSPAGVYLGSTHKIYTDHENDDTVRCFDSLPELLESDFCDEEGNPREWNFAAMQQIVYTGQDPRNVID